MTRATARLAALVVLCCGACEKDPDDPQTWVDQLDDRSKMSEALARLEYMGDPRSVKPLGEAWRRSNKQSQILRTLIAVAGKTDAKTGKAAWGDAVPFLIEAVNAVWEGGSRRAVDDGVVAASALGRSGDPAAVPVLLDAAQRQLPMRHEGNPARLAAIRALGNFHDPKVIDVLTKILEAPTDKQLVQLNAAAALALAESGDQKALPALTRAMIFVPAIFPQVRTAITRVGKPAVRAMTAVYQERDAELAKLMKERGFDKKAPGNMVYKGATLLGDLRAREAVPMLLEGLKTEPRIAYYDERSGAPGPTTHQGILGALRLILDPATAGAVKAYWSNPKTDDGVRPLAIDVYGMLATDASALAELLKYAKDETQEPTIRQAAIVAYGRLARTREQQKPIDDLKAGYEEKLRKAEAKKPEKDEEKAKVEDEKAIAAFYRDALAEAQARIGVAIECKDDPGCYAKAVPVRDPKAAKPAQKPTDKQNADMVFRAERALLELAKMGDRGRGTLDTLLQGVDSKERFVRQAILLALPRIAPLPCTKCADRLNQVIEDQSNETTLDFLTSETRIVYNYFLWAGK
ncbi:MAG TPA: HEAT repeat domain-containing protein [Haliangiales bacterium]|nr:HEAT repeat domain-containing protein [Haliangiales bacterium]